jgi:hypothetical protein
MPFDSASSTHQTAKLFDADEIGWIAAEAAVVAARLGKAVLADAHRAVPALGLLAGHPRLRCRLADAGSGLVGATYLARWDGSAPLPVGTDAQNFVVFLGWRGGLDLVGAEAVASEPGLVLTAEAHTLAAAQPAGAAPAAVLVLSYAQGGDALADVADDALWPQAWSAAG